MAEKPDEILGCDDGFGGQRLGSNGYSASLIKCVRKLWCQAAAEGHVRGSAHPTGQKRVVFCVAPNDVIMIKQISIDRYNKLVRDDAEQRRQAEVADAAASAGRAALKRARTGGKAGDDTDDSAAVSAAAAASAGPSGDDNVINVPDTDTLTLPDVDDGQSVGGSPTDSYKEIVAAGLARYVP